jgi:hypothetical protein
MHVSRTRALNGSYSRNWVGAQLVRLQTCTENQRSFILPFCAVERHQPRKYQQVSVCIIVSHTARTVDAYQVCVRRFIASVEHNPDTTTTGHEFQNRMVDSTRRDSQNPQDPRKQPKFTFFNRTTKSWPIPAQTSQPR